MATHSTALAWRIPGTGEPGGLPSMGLHRVRHDWNDLAAAAEHLQGQCSWPFYPTVSQAWVWCVVRWAWPRVACGRSGQPVILSEPWLWAGLVLRVAERKELKFQVQVTEQGRLAACAVLKPWIITCVPWEAVRLPLGIPSEVDGLGALRLQEWELPQVWEVAA